MATKKKTNSEFWEQLKTKQDKADEFVESSGEKCPGCGKESMATSSIDSPSATQLIRCTHCGWTVRVIYGVVGYYDAQEVMFHSKGKYSLKERALEMIKKIAEKGGKT